MISIDRFQPGSVPRPSELGSSMAALTSCFHSSRQVGSWGRPERNRANGSRSLVATHRSSSSSRNPDCLNNSGKFVEKSAGDSSVKSMFPRRASWLGPRYRVGTTELDYDFDTVAWDHASGYFGWLAVECRLGYSHDLHDRHPGGDL
jgi:hypothetical protein